MSYEFRGRTRSAVEAETGGPRRSRASGPGRGPKEARSLLQKFAAVMGAAFLLAGIAGFIPGLTSNYDELKFAGHDSAAKLLGLFQVSVLHNIVHLIFGVGLLAAARWSWSRAYLLGGGVAYLGVLLYGALVDRGSDANLLPINSADNLLHLGLALAMIALGIIGVRAAGASRH